MKKENGFAHAVLIIGLVIALLGALGYIYWQNFIYQEPVPAEVVTADDTNEVYQPTIPTGWVRTVNDELGISYYTPDGDEDMSVDTFAVDELIPVGYGAPVFVQYSKSDGWNTYEYDSNNEPVRATINLVMPLDAKVADTYPADMYITGDGGTSELRIVVVKDSTVYQFAFKNQSSSDFGNRFVPTVEL